MARSKRTPATDPGLSDRAARPHRDAVIVDGQGTAVLLPTAALVGTLMLLIADAIGRDADAPIELPAGMVTAVIGMAFCGIFWLTQKLLSFITLLDSELIRVVNAVKSTLTEEERHRLFP